MNPSVIIAAISSRAYVQAAVAAGFEVIAIDVFADIDTQKLALAVHKVNCDECGFNADELLSLLQRLDLSGLQGMCFGAGFEAQPELLTEIYKLLPVLGNLPDTIEKVKNPQIFSALCDVFEMPTPAISMQRPRNSLGWLAKQVGGCGGAHIKPLLPLDLLYSQPQKMPVYYQKIQAGESVSCLFLADGVHAEIASYNEQWCASTAMLPYRYGGAVSHTTVTQSNKNKIEQFIKAMTFKLGLRGLNSADFLIDNNTVYALEINPRLSATLDLITAKRGDYFASHIASCQAQLTEWPSVKNTAKAQHIIYANKAAKVPVDLEWDDYVVDIPQPNTDIAAGMPICTVTAKAHTARLAKQKVLERAADL